MKLPDKQIVIISGHYGTGKTEFAVNLAMIMAKSGLAVALADLDIINPYFRSLERRDELEKEGVKVHTTSKDGRIDIPALPPEILSIFAKKDQQSIIDLGGDPVGARVLGYYRPQLEEIAFDFWFVINQNRPESSSYENIVHYIKETEIASGQKITGLVNNSHLGRETTTDDILRGDLFARNIAEKLSLPLIYTTAERRFENEVAEFLQDRYFPLDIYMIKPWELSETKGGHFEWLDM